MSLNSIDTATLQPISKTSPCPLLLQVLGPTSLIWCALFTIQIHAIWGSAGARQPFARPRFIPEQQPASVNTRSGSSAGLWELSDLLDTGTQVLHRPVCLYPLKETCPTFCFGYIFTCRFLLIFFLLRNVSTFSEICFTSPVLISYYS